MLETGVLPTESGPGGLRDVLRGYMDVAERLQRTDEALQREVVRLRTELASKDRELERRRRLAALGELAAGVAHEVRNPLGAIQLYSGLLKKQCGELAPALELIRKIEAGIQAIEGVVQDTLALAPRGAVAGQRRLAAVIARVADVCAGKLAERRVTLTTRSADEATWVKVDEAGLQRALVNLVINAAEASSAGQTVLLTCEPARAGRVMVRVLDDGAGLPDDVLDRVFDPFFTTKAHGTGLGLTLAHRLVEAHGGRLSAQNRADGGAEFVLELPTVNAGDQAGDPTSGVRQTTAA